MANSKVMAREAGSSYRGALQSHGNGQDIQSCYRKGEGLVGRSHIIYVCTIPILQMSEVKPELLSILFKITQLVSVRGLMRT